MKTALWVILLLFSIVSTAYGDGIILEKPPSPLYFCSGDSYWFVIKFHDIGDTLTINWNKLGTDGMYHPINVNELGSNISNDTITKTFSLGALVSDIEGRYWIFVTNNVDKENYEFDVKIVQSPVINNFSPANPLINCLMNSVNLQPSLSGTTLNSNYSWRYNNNDVSNSKDYMATNPGAYLFTVLNVESTKVCSASATVTVKYDGASSPHGKIIMEPSKITCKSSSVELTAYDFSNVTSYSWILPNNTTQLNSLTITANTPGPYKLKLSNGNVACDTILNVQVELDTLRPVLNFKIDSYSICENQDEIKIAYQPPVPNNYSFNWNTFERTSFIVVSQAGTYSVTVTNSDNGCTKSTGWAIQKKNPYFTKKIQTDTILSDSSVFVFNVPTMVPSNASMEWKVTQPIINAKLIAGNLSGTGKISLKFGLIDGEMPGSAWVTVQPVYSACKGDKDSIKISINPKINAEDEPFVPEIITPNGDGQNDDWNIIWPNNSVERNVVLYNRSGGKVLESTTNPVYGDLVQLVDGVYFYVLKFKIGEEVKTTLGSIMVLHGRN